MYEELGALEPYHFECTDLSFSADAAGDTAGDMLLRGLGGSTCGEHRMFYQQSVMLLLLALLAWKLKAVPQWSKIG